MTVTIKTPEQIEKMRVAGRLAAEVLEMLIAAREAGRQHRGTRPHRHDHIVNVQKAIPANVGYKGFPKTLCTSVNNVICHGIPSPSKILKDGDIVNIDVTVIKDGWHGDTSRMYFVGEPSVLAKRLVDTTLEAMLRGIGEVRPGATLGDIGHAIQKYVEAQGFSVVREYCGHGIGQIYHEDPQVLHYGQPGAGLKLQKGMTFTIEPMVNAGKPHTRLLPDGWTVVTKDHSLSAQWEHTHRGHRRRLRNPDGVAERGLSLGDQRSVFHSCWSGSIFGGSAGRRDTLASAIIRPKASRLRALPLTGCR